MVQPPRLFIDKLSLTIPIPTEGVQETEERLAALERRSDAVRGFQERGRYRTRYALSLDSGELVNIWTGARNEGARGLKIEYSPERIGDTGREELTRILRAILRRGYRRLFYAGSVQRIDMTFDVRRVPITDLYFVDHRAGPPARAIIQSAGRSGETLYLGYNATRQLIVYDKNAEQGRTEARTPWTRVEYRYTKGDYRLGELHDHLRNPYSQFTVRRYRALPGSSTELSRAIFDALRLRGTAAEVRPGTSLARYAEQLPYWPTWTRNRLIWAQLRTRIDELLA